MKSNTLFFLLAWAGCSAVLAQDGMPPSPVTVAPAALVPIQSLIEVPATVYSKNDAKIASEVAGRLLEVLEPGTHVQKGDRVALIDSKPLALRGAELKANIQRVQAQLHFQQGEVKRLANLAKKNNAAERELSQARSDLAVAKADLAAARAQWAQLQDQIERATLRAPFAAVVAQRFKQAGERVGVDDDIVRLVDVSTLEVVARVPLRYLAFVSKGMALRVGGADASEALALTRLITAGDDTSHQFEMHLDLPVGRWPVGEPLRLSVPTSVLRRVLTVPRDALVLRAEKTFLYRVGADNTAERIPVIPGIGSGNRVEVEGALAPGDRVIIRGNERLRPGATVRILDAG